jgi:hypothetical protein
MRSISCGESPSSSDGKPAGKAAGGEPNAAPPSFSTTSSLSFFSGALLLAAPPSGASSGAAPLGKGSMRLPREPGVGEVTSTSEKRDDVLYVGRRGEGGAADVASAALAAVTGGNATSAMSLWVRHCVPDVAASRAASAFARARRRRHHSRSDAPTHTPATAAATAAIMTAADALSAVARAAALALRLPRSAPGATLGSGVLTAGTGLAAAGGVAGKGGNGGDAGGNGRGGGRGGGGAGGALGGALGDACSTTSTRVGGEMAATMSGASALEWTERTDEATAVEAARRSRRLTMLAAFMEGVGERSAVTVTCTEPAATVSAT